MLFIWKQIYISKNPVIFLAYSSFKSLLVYGILCFEEDNWDHNPKKQPTAAFMYVFWTNEFLH